MIPRSPSATASTSGGPGSDVRINSAPCAAPRGLSAPLAPRSRCGFTISDRVSCTTRAWPAFMRFWAIGPPMFPSPMNPMRIVASDRRAVRALSTPRELRSDAITRGRHEDRRHDMTTRGIDAVLAHLAKLPPPESLTLAEQRAQYERAERAFPIPTDVTVERVTAPIAPAEWLAPPSVRADVVVLYLHGGGYVIGSPRSHRHLAAAIARAARARALVLDYRLAPEHPFPAALEDSAGGGLTVATLVALRELGVPLPAAGVCISPWVDLTCSAPSYATNAAADPIVRPAIVAEMARAYLAGADPKTPLASPRFADLSGLPPLLIHVGRDEVLLDDATGLAECLKVAGVAARLEIVPRMVHVCHWFLPMLDEAQTAVDEIGAFVNAHVG